MQIKLERRRVDPKDGSVSLEKKIVNISEKDPYNSIEYHKICDALGIKKFDRIDPHITEKLATVYNYVANLLKTNDVLRIEKAINNFRKNAELNAEGVELVDKIYRTVREDILKTREKEAEREALERQEEMLISLKSKSERAAELRSSERKIKREHEKDVKKKTEEGLEAIKEHKASVDDFDKVDKIKDIPLKDTSEQL